MIKRLTYLLLLLIIVCAVFAAWMVHYAKTPLNLSPSAQEITIKPNSSLNSVAQQLVSQHVIPNTFPFVVLVRVMQKSSFLQAGDYVLNKNITPYQLMLSLNHGKATQGSITFIEGKTFKDMLAKLSNNEAVKHASKDMSEKEILTHLGIDKTRAEGLFFPDTFYFNRGTSDLNLLKIAHDMMQTKLEKAWQNRADNLPYQNSYEALIMASIVEKETGKASERAMIAGVFINRLKIGMRLQTDPTVIYGLGDKYDGNIHKKDLETDTAYNTYTRAGLPPTPIAMPGMASIEAALHPEATKALYFVGKGDGSHVFSNSLAEHNRAVAKYQLKSK